MRPPIKRIVPWIFIGLVASAVSIWTGITARELDQMEDAYRAGQEAGDRALREGWEKLRQPREWEKKREEMQKEHQRMLEELKPRI